MRIYIIDIGWLDGWCWSYISNGFHSLIWYDNMLPIHFKFTMVLFLFALQWKRFSYFCRLLQPKIQLWSASMNTLHWFWSFFFHNFFFFFVIWFVHHKMQLKKKRPNELNWAHGESMKVENKKDGKERKLKLIEISGHLVNEYKKK